MLLLYGCSADAGEGIFQYKDSYVGDNSAVGNIANHLPGAEYLNGFELKTKEEPYGITLKYDWKGSEQAYKESVIYNATYFYALVQNVDWITFQSELRDYTITKEDLQKWYGKELYEIKNEDELLELIEEHLDDKSINSLLM